jgi:hypothetical protein
MNKEAGTKNGNGNANRLGSLRMSIKENCVSREDKFSNIWNFIQYDYAIHLLIRFTN